MKTVVKRFKEVQSQGNTTDHIYAWSVINAKNRQGDSTLYVLIIGLRWLTNKKSGVQAALTIIASILKHSALLRCQ